MRTKKAAFSNQPSAFSYRTGNSEDRKLGTRICSSVLLHVRTFALLLMAVYCLRSSGAFAEELRLQDLIDEALKNNHDLIISGLKVSTSKYKIPQATSLPDPMFMVGYQNEGWNRYTYGEMQGSQWMFTASQTFPFPGKLGLKGEMAEKDSEGLKEFHESARLAIISRVKELYYDLFLIHKNIDLVREKAALLSRIEDAALARYSTGRAPQQEVLMAQTEKYMLLEKEEMLKQKMQATEAALNTAVGRDVNSPLGMPVEPLYSTYDKNLEALINLSYENSPQLKAKEKMVASSDARVRMSKKEYYPDFTINGTVAKRRGEFEDMWSLATTVNIPIFYRTKQKMAVLEAESGLSEAQHELDAAKIMLASSIRENYSMVKSADRLMELYKNGLIPKTLQDFELSISGYISGKVEALTVITRVKSLIDYELSYWVQFVEREKAIARLEALTGVNQASGLRYQGEEKK